MVETAGVPPSPAQRLLQFRQARMRESVGQVAYHAGQFRRRTEDVLSRGDSAGPASEEGIDTRRALAKGFSAAYLALTEALDAARAGSVVTGPALAALEGIQSALRNRYLEAVAGIREDLQRLRGGPSALEEFCVAAAEKVDKLEQFWIKTFEHAPKLNALPQARA